MSPASPSYSAGSIGTVVIPPLGTILGCVATPLVFCTIYGFALMLLFIPASFTGCAPTRHFSRCLSEGCKMYMKHTRKLVPHVY